MKRRYDYNSTEWKMYKQTFADLKYYGVSAGYNYRTVAKEIVAQHRPPPLVAVILLDVYGKEVKTLPKVGDYVRHKHTRIADKIVRVSGTAYKLADGGILPFSQLASDYLVEEDTSSSTATAEDDGWYVATEVETELKLTKEVSHRVDRVNATHNPDAPQTQEEIDAAWQRHKDFFGRG